MIEKKAIIVFLFFFILSCSTTNYGRVIKVFDGDTIRVLLDNGKLINVRYLGIDTPETSHPQRPIEEFGYEAKEENTKLILNKRVKIEYDIKKMDKYGRALAYVYDESNRMVNLYLAKNGFAELLIIPPNNRYSELFIKAVKNARTKKIGLWAHFIRIKQSNASSYIGSFVETNFYVRSINKKDRITFINSTVHYQDDFTLVIFSRDYNKFPDLLSWEGKNIQVKGKIIPYNGPEIVIKERWQVNTRIIK